ncbi:hypothetical protein [Bradyrhizobium oligotrophicum]|uniref:hypothetical protein n=1 Tax=Bradyrhizobium oligotrophicum TaxID=44255 RepID=UPI003EBA70BD
MGLSALRTSWLQEEDGQARVRRGDAAGPDPSLLLSFEIALDHVVKIRECYQEIKRDFDVHFGPLVVRSGEVALSHPKAAEGLPLGHFGRLVIFLLN